MSEYYVVEVKRPEGVTRIEMCEYIAAAVRTVRGMYVPEDPLFNLDVKSVKVSILGSSEGPKKLRASAR